jgi:hypothetical protein
VCTSIDLLVRPCLRAGPVRSRAPYATLCDFSRCQRGKVPMTNPHRSRNTALGTAFRHLRRELKGVAVRITRNAADADDIVQLAFF